jgi:DNA-binding NarL/FixJ family response regulator
LIRECLSQLLQTFPEFHVVATAGSGTAALEEVDTHRPHVVVMDVPTPGPPSLGTVRRVRRAHPFVKVVVLTSNQQPVYVQEAFAAGANAYLSRQIGADELRRALVTVHHEGAALGSGVAAHVLQLLARRSAVHGSSPVSMLTERERQILFMIAEDYRTEPIARRLGIRTKTVRNHISSIYSKLGTSDRVQTALYAKRLFGLLHEASVPLVAPPAAAPALSNARLDALSWPE